MKKIILFLFTTLIIFQVANAQNIGINSTGATPAASAMLDISSTDKGLLIPRVALTETNTANPVIAPATSLLVYNTATAGVAPNNVIPGYYYWNGTSWTPFGSGANWSLAGNGGTDPSANFIGTTDDADLVFQTDGSEVLRLYSGGGAQVNAGGGLNDPAEGSAIYAYGEFNNFLEINVQNNSNGDKASSDIVATANNGTGSSVYVDMGINSQGYSNGASNILTGPNLAYLYSNARDFKIGNGARGYKLIFFTNPTNGQESTTTGNGIERMRITDAGYVGIRTTNPNSYLTVNGSLSMAVRTGNTAYTISDTDHVVIHTGNSARTWTLPAASSCTGRIYKLVNNGTIGADITLTESVRLNGITTTMTLPVTAGSNIYQIISDGTSWIKIN